MSALSASLKAQGQKGKIMGHMNVCENLKPIAERVGCAKHETYDANCFGCFIANGGGND